MAEKAKVQTSSAKTPAQGRPSSKAPAAARGVENPDVKPEGYVPRLKSFYKATAVPELMRRLGLENPMECPRLEKIVVNMGVSEAKENIQALDGAREELGALTGQLPEVRRAKKSISNFKLRQGMPIGLRVTLRGDRMWEFLDRLVSIAIPRIRDFRGLDPSAFDGRGAYNLGLREQHIFSEIDLEKAARMRGMNITLRTTAGNDDGGRELLALLGFPFRKPKGQTGPAAAPTGALRA